MSINPTQLFQMFRSGGNPQQMIQQLMGDSQITNNPIAMNALQMFQSGDMDGLQTMAENLCREKNTTPDEVKNKIMQQFGMK